MKNVEKCLGLGKNNSLMNLTIWVRIHNIVVQPNVFIEVYLKRHFYLVSSRNLLTIDSRFWFFRSILKLDLVYWLNTTNSCVYFPVLSQDIIWNWCSLIDKQKRFNWYNFRTDICLINSRLYVKYIQYIIKRKPPFPDQHGESDLIVLTDKLAGRHVGPHKLIWLLFYTGRCRRHCWFLCLWWESCQKMEQNNTEIWRGMFIVFPELNIKECCQQFKNSSFLYANFTC